MKRTIFRAICGVFIFSIMVIPSHAQDVEKILPPAVIGKEAAGVDEQQQAPGFPEERGITEGVPSEKKDKDVEEAEKKPAVGIEEEVELKESEEIIETVPAPYTRNVKMPKIEAGPEPSRLELLFLGRISQEKQVLKQFGYEIFKFSKEKALDLEREKGKFPVIANGVRQGEQTDAGGVRGIEETFLSVVPPAGFDKSYILAPGDVVQIFLSGEEVNIFLTRIEEEGKKALLPLSPLPIDPEGKVYYPPVGEVYLWGKSIGDAEAYLKKEMGKYIKDVQVSISLRGIRRFPVYVVGEVEKPGRVYVNGFSSVIDALSLAGGVKKTGSLRKIQVNRNDRKISELDIYGLLLKGERKADVLLKDRDVVVVPPVGRTAAVWGMVKRPGIFELIEGEDVSSLLAFAGGPLPGADTSSMKLTTYLPSGKKMIKEVTVGQSDIVPGDGDVFKITPLADELKEFVELKGHVKRPGMYQWREGMRVSEIIGSGDNFLPEGLFDYGEIVRRLPPDYEPVIVSFNPLKAVEGSPQDNLEVMAGDIITLFSVWDFKKKPFVRIEGEVESPGRYRWVKGMTVRDLLRISGGLTRASRLDEAELWRYEVEDSAYVLKFSRKLDLVKILQGEEDQIPELMPFDQVVIKGIGSYGQLVWKTMVRGEVTSPGTYPIKRGDRISDLIERAGGMSSYAYSRGIVLLRKSVEELQRERLKVLISELESSLFQEEASSAFGAETGEIALRKQVLESRKQLIRVMKEKMELVVGRVVVELDRDLEKFRGTERDLELESGDELYIPSVPSFVLMMGDVFNQVGLTYKPEKRLRYYLREVGGLTKNADKKGIYIIRADGTVVSNETNEFADMVHWDGSRNRFSVGGIYVEGIYPGDTVIVPTETKFPIPWRPLIKDITQIIFQSLSTVAIINNL